MTPAARITLDGRDITTRLVGPNAVLGSLTITDEAGIESDAAEIEIDDREANKPPKIGSEFKVWLGYEPEPKYIGDYKVLAWTKRGPRRSLSFTATAAELTSKLKAQKTRSHHATTLGAIVRKIAAENNVSPVIDSALTSIVVDHIDQQTESDAAFLTRLAKRNGATFKLADGKLIFTAKGSKKLPSGKAKPVITIKPTQVSDWEATTDERGNFSSVICCYRNGTSGKRIQVKAGNGDPCHRDKRLYSTEVAARNAANAQLGDFKRGKITVDINAPGIPEIYAEALIKLDGFDEDVDAEYFCKSVTHTFDGSGFQTRFTLESGGG